MKRSKINNIMKESTKFLKEMNFNLPPFAFWRVEDWEKNYYKYKEIIDNMLGWDITDFGGNNFIKKGLIMFTLRNGNIKNNKYEKPYAEKILIVEESQITPYHFHWSKMEDIINRGGGNLLIKFYNSTQNNRLDKQNKVLISKDGYRKNIDPGTVIKLKPGESVTVNPKIYHKFWGESNSGKILLGEISTVNDDNIDNNFLNNVNRFSNIIEDEIPLYLLSNEYKEKCNIN